jgi:hypothetical protein
LAQDKAIYLVHLPLIMVWKCLAVDMSEIQTQGAVRFDKKAIRAQGHLNEDEQQHPLLKHATEKITPDNISEVLARWSPDSTEDK